MRIFKKRNGTGIIGITFSAGKGDNILVCLGVIFAISDVFRSILSTDEN